MPVANTVLIRGKEYSINSFSDIHLSTINKLLNDIGDLSAQNDAGFILKEVILPDLPVDIIRPTGSGKYIILLNARELNFVITEIIKVYYNRELEEAQKSGDVSLEAQIKANITEMQINDAIAPVNDLQQQQADELAQLRAENALLKAGKAD